MSSDGSVSSSLPQSTVLPAADASTLDDDDIDMNQHDDELEEEEEEEEDDGSVGSLKDFVLPDTVPVEKAEAVRNPLVDVDPQNIVTGKRVRKPTQRYMPRKYLEYMLDGVPAEEFEAALGKDVVAVLTGVAAPPPSDNADDDASSLGDASVQTGADTEDDDYCVNNGDDDEAEDGGVEDDSDEFDDDDDEEEEEYVDDDDEEDVDGDDDSSTAASVDAVTQINPATPPA